MEHKQLGLNDVPRWRKTLEGIATLQSSPKEPVHVKLPHVPGPPNRRAYGKILSAEKRWYRVVAYNDSVLESFGQEALEKLNVRTDIWERRGASKAQREFLKAAKTRFAGHQLRTNPNEIRELLQDGVSPGQVEAMSVAYLEHVDRLTDEFLASPSASEYRGSTFQILALSHRSTATRA